MSIVIFTFETTHQAMWAEEVTQEAGLPVEVAPAPAHVDAKCGLSLRTPTAHAGRVSEALTREGIEFGMVEEEGVEA